MYVGGGEQRHSSLRCKKQPEVMTMCGYRFEYYLKTAIWHGDFNIWDPDASFVLMQGTSSGALQHLNLFINISFKVHTIKDRYLMMVKNITADLFWPHLPFIAVREILIWGYLILHPKLMIEVVKALRVTLPTAYSKRKRMHRLGSRRIIMNTFEFKATDDDTGPAYT
jgi:hypothetical protein